MPSSASHSLLTNSFSNIDRIGIAKAVPIFYETMRKVIGIGETILDIIFRDDQPIGAVPGGSMFNGLISLGRSGVDAAFISETGNDRVGRRIISFLEDNHVDASNISVYPEAKSPVSLAFLNENNDAEYIFYKDHPHDRLEFITPDIQPNDVVMFGSFYAINPVIRPQMLAFLQYAHEQGAMILRICITRRGPIACTVRR